MGGQILGGDRVQVRDAPIGAELHEHLFERKGHRPAVTEPPGAAVGNARHRQLTSSCLTDTRT